ncbi:MAG: PIN domain-containing protein [Candidatus Liptonbacteria bacterium]|nr:PIN domain-containing protein [Candidatus Liptonbacteria bacterium]
MSEVRVREGRAKAFLDTAFLASFSIPNHKDNKKARILLAELTLKYDLYTAPLCFYELWQVVKEYKDFYKGNYQFIRKLNKVLKLIHCKILFNEINLSYKAVINDLKSFTKQILGSMFITVIPSDRQSINSALDAIDEFLAKPGDAFHFSSMDSAGIETVVTGNRKDFERMGLHVIWF